MQSIDRDQRRAALGLRHHLVRPTDSCERVAADLVGVHSSDPVTVYLSMRARLHGFTIDDLDDSLYEHRTLVRILGMRRTLFVVPLDLAAVIDAACTSGLVGAEERRLIRLLEDQGIAADGGSWLGGAEAATLAALDARGTATARDLRQDVPDLTLTVTYGEGTRWGGEFGMSTRVLFMLSARGKIVRARPTGTWLSGQYRWSTARHWLGADLGEMSADEAEDVLVSRWLQSYGPGTLTDVKWWTGWGVRQTRAALDRIDAEEVDLGSGPGFVAPGTSLPSEPPPRWVAFLPGLDSTTMGWKERDWYLGSHTGMLFDTNGNAGPTIWCDGRIVGGWGQRTDGSVEARVLEQVDSTVADMIEHEAERLSSWFDGRVTTPRFRTPLEREIRGSSA